MGKLMLECALTTARDAAGAFRTWLLVRRAGDRELVRQIPFMSSSSAAKTAGRGDIQRFLDGDIEADLADPDREWDALPGAWDITLERLLNNLHWMPLASYEAGYSRGFRDAEDGHEHDDNPLSNTPY